MDDKTKRDLHRFLAGGKLSRPETDAIRESVLDTIEREEKRPARVIRYAGWAGAALAAAAAVLIGVNLPSTPSGDLPVAGNGDDPHARRGAGSGSHPAAVLEVSCSPGELTACPTSSTLVFSVSGRRVRGFLSAYAEPIGHEAPRVFYFSKEDQSAVLSTADGGTREHAVSAGSLGPGRYRVHAFLAERRLGRNELEQGAPEGVLAKATVELVIVP